MESPLERLEPRLRGSALMVLRRHGIGIDELQLIHNEPRRPLSCLIKGHRVRIEIDDSSAFFDVRASRWRGARRDYPTSGAFLASFEESLHAALTGA